jgi:hypothetical protein
MVQGDDDHDHCTGGSYAEVTVVLSSTQASRPSNRQWTRTADSQVEVQDDGAGDHYIGDWCAHDGFNSFDTVGSFANAAVLVYIHSQVVLQCDWSNDLFMDIS